MSEKDNVPSRPQCLPGESPADFATRMAQRCNESGQQVVRLAAQNKAMREVVVAARALLRAFAEQRILIGDENVEQLRGALRDYDFGNVSGAYAKTTTPDK